MRRIALVIAAALTACGPAPTPDAPAKAAPPPRAMAAPQVRAEDAAHNRMAPLLPHGGREACSVNGAWCVRTASDAAEIVYTDGAAAPVSFSVPPVDEATAAPWPIMVSDASGAHVWLGVIWTKSQSYSGGDAAAGALSLYEIDAAAPAAPRPVLTAPTAGDISIRACFSPQDEQKRHEACADQYQFLGTLRLDVANTATAPRFVLQTRARTYPGHRSRDADSSQAPPLTPEDLVWAQDATCSYVRVFTADASGAYTPDQALPACADYLEP